MKVQSIPSGYNYTRVNNLHATKQKQQVATNPSKTNISFSSLCWYDKFYVYSNFDPLNASTRELDELAEICHLSGYDTEHAINERYDDGFLGLFSKEGERKRKLAKAALLPRISKVNKHRTEQLTQLGKLKALEALGASNIVEQKINVKQQFLMPLKMSANNRGANITNGIILYGKADSNTKDEFAKWIATEATEFGTGNTTIRYMPHNPEQSFELIRQGLEAARNHHRITNSHTIIHLDGIDKLLVSHNDDISMDYINEFKTLVENASRKYHATFLIKTNLPLRDFDSASIGDQRFGLKVKLANGITPDQVKEIEKIEKEINRLDEKAKKSSDYFEWKQDCYDDDWYGSPAEQIGR